MHVKQRYDLLIATFYLEFWERKIKQILNMCKAVKATILKRKKKKHITPYFESIKKNILFFFFFI